MSAPTGTVKEVSETVFLNILKTRPKQPTAFVVSFGPTTARNVLQRHGKLNRKIAPAHAKQLADDMIGNRWEVNGETVIFDVDGKLEDGYHRFTGCAMYDTTFKTMVTIGVPKDSWKSIDQGRSRSLSNILEWEGFDKKGTGRLQSLIRFCMVYELNADRTLSVSGPMGLEWLKDNPDVVKSEPWMKEARMARIGLLPTIVAGLHYEALKLGHDKTVVDEFFTKLTSGLGLAEGNPAYTLRKKMLNGVQVNRNGVASEYTEHEQKFMMIRALNAFLKGEQMRQSRTPRKGEQKVRIIEP